MASMNTLTHMYVYSIINDPIFWVAYGAISTLDDLDCKSKYTEGDA